MKILWVEDNERFVRGTRAQFLSSHEITHVTTLAQAREALFCQKFDVVLLDYDLPDGKGSELLEATRVAGVVFVIATSSHGAGNTALQLAGANAVCSKLQFQTLPSILDAITISR